MRIDPHFLTPHLEAAAIEQVTSQMRADGFEVECNVPVGGEGQGASVFDIVAKRGGETIFLEVKVLGQPRAEPSRQLSRLAAVARQNGGRFRLVVVRPEREVQVSVIGLEEALREALTDDPTGELGLLGDRVAVEDVSDVEIERLVLRPGREAEVAGRAMLTVSQTAEGGNFEFARSDFPFSFHVVLSPDGSVQEAPEAEFLLDLSSWYGSDADARD
jgi:Holliday junction resolvase